MRKYQNSLFLFRRDLRLEDNTGLINASKFSSKVFPCFIWDEKIISKSNPKFSEFRLQFLKESLSDLDAQLKENKSKLYFFSGNYEKVIQKIIKEIRIDAIFMNKDYTPFSIKRENKIRNKCHKNKMDFILTQDSLLQDPDTIKTIKGEPYKVFSAFFRKAKELPVRNPQKYKFGNFARQKIKFESTSKNFLKEERKNTFLLPGGRSSCLKLLKNLKNLRNYDSERDFPAKNGTSLLSAHNKFGTCSIREIFLECKKELGANHTIISELFWRDFFTYLMYHFPQSYSKEFIKNFQKIPWKKDKSVFSKWANGETGFPIVDAGMRELNQTGLMHNRVRMIVASFLTKDLHIDWRWGERYFSTKLIDYDTCVNVGNWQWSASTGCDAQPWFRIFNPWIQQKRFDPDCKYIKKWIPELSDVPSKTIHELWKKFPEKLEYPSPIVEHSVESKKAKDIFKKFSTS
ncbi:deoxyribodipyrimidine photo-lyase [Candidatus Nitrosopumilus sp. SW]|uniref:cryptochrome/photolyase family protein n=1 Tax=Candidatus Nitrosopumilus sp. SW TaxID=2508726 RepID=UPI001154A6B5|nr:deoxyribodipyrimidine photo-lyase [Candidatus Nitrosopumilus sp. SW]QDI89583.1 deoxyribodipyrimidine photo-lyase [Candidatus Nitrosopumilus sp. SW]